MKIVYEPRLIEQAVFHRVRQEPELEPAIHAVLDPLYLLPPGDERDARFDAAYIEFFRQLELDAVIPTWLNERPDIVDHVRSTWVREAPARKVEGADLLVKKHPDGAVERTLLIQITALNLARPSAVEDHFRRELLHVADMLDNDFGYDPADLAGWSPEDFLRRDRYHVLWAMSVESRLDPEGRSNGGRLAALRKAYHRVFGPAGEAGGLTFDDRLRHPLRSHRQMFRAASMASAYADDMCATADS